MATSGTNTFTVDRDEVISAALRVLGVIGVGETPIAEDYTNCSEALNIMIKSWAKKGFPLWVYETVVLDLIEDLSVYPIGPTAGYISSVSSTGGTGYTAGTWTAVGGTTGTVASGTYTVDGDVPDVFTVLVAGNSYTTAPTSFTLSGAGTGATITGVVAGVTMSRPLRIIDAFIRNPQDFDTSLIIISQQEYDILGNKFSEGIPNQLYYDNQLVNGLVYPYNVITDTGYSIYMTTQRMFEDMTTGANTFDFPQEWFQALKWGLAAELAEEYGADENKIMRVESKAAQYVMECFDWSQEEVGVYFSPNYQGTVR
jgi:hypothetical protein